jgi:hypothetical protein
MDLSPLASCFLFASPFSAATIVIASIGQALAHFPHPMHVSSAIPAI